RMLPYIVAHNRVVAFHQWAVLVGSGDDLKVSTRIKNKPCPTGAKPLHASIVECGFEGIEGAEGGVDRVCQFASGCATTVGLHNGPEHSVVGVATSVVAYRCTDILRYIIDMPQKLVNRYRSELRLILDRGVQIVDIGGMVFVVMHLHRL